MKKMLLMAILLIGAISYGAAGEYEIVRSSEEPDSEASVEKATVKKNSICDETICIGYDVELKKAVFIDPEDMRVIYPEW